MSRPCIRPILLLVALSAHGGAGPASAQSTGVDRVEEDWELVIAEPDYVAVGPQITTT